MATGDNWIATGTSITWTDSGLGDHVMSLQALATVAGRVGTRVSLGAFPRTGWYSWYLEIEAAVAPTLDQVVELYFGGWHGSAPAFPQAQLPATDTGYAAGAAGLSKRSNLPLAGLVRAETAAVGPFSNSGVIFLPYTHVSPLIYNGFGQALKNTAGANFLRLTPINAQVQS